MSNSAFVPVRTYVVRHPRPDARRFNACEFYARVCRRVCCNCCCSCCVSTEGSVLAAASFTSPLHAALNGAPPQADVAVGSTTGPERESLTSARALTASAPSTEPDSSPVAAPVVAPAISTFTADASEPATDAVVTVEEGAAVPVPATSGIVEATEPAVAFEAVAVVTDNAAAATEPESVSAEAAPVETVPLETVPLEATATEPVESELAAATERPTLAKFIESMRSAGLTSSQLVLHVDCTKSNLDNGAVSYDGRSLHDVSPGAPPNPYMQVISALGAAVAAFDDDGRIPLFGFGDRACADEYVSDFSSEPPVGVDGALAAYVARIPSVDLAGPTSFAPSIRKTMELVRAAGRDPATGRPRPLTFTLCVIIADGQVTAVKETAKAIADASHLPIAIICVGVGDGPWEGLRAWDAQRPSAAPGGAAGAGDGVPLFDNFKAVILTDVAERAKREGYDLAELLALTALDELPAAFAAAKRLRLFDAQSS